MNTHTDSTTSPAYRAPSTARIGRVRLAVSDLKRSAAFYTKVIGLAQHNASDSKPSGPIAHLGVAGGPVLLTLEQRAGVRPLLSRSRLGLYHTAFLLPSRAALADFVHHLRLNKIPFGSADHGVSEAIYLTDPDGLEVEVYADRERSEWAYQGTDLTMTIDPLRFDSLAAAATGNWQGAPPATKVGHMHFYIQDLNEGLRFYQQGLGLEVTAASLPRARFLSVGGYHHHVGINTWIAGSHMASEEDARLLDWEWILPGNDVKATSENLRALGFTGDFDSRRFQDPCGITVKLASS